MSKTYKKSSNENKIKTKYNRSKVIKELNRDDERLAKLVSSSEWEISDKDMGIVYPLHHYR